MSPRKAQSSLSAVQTLMEDYAKRGVFRGFSKQRARNGIAAFRLIWHRDRVFDLIVDTEKKTIVIPVVLPGVPSGSPLYKDFKTFVESNHAATLPDHRRIEKTKARARCANRRGSVSLTMAIRDHDYGYALQRLIHLVHETFLIFLTSGPYRDYLVEQLGAESEVG
jgi:hypothetical protein